MFHRDFDLYRLGSLYFAVFQCSKSRKDSASPLHLGCDVQGGGGHNTEVKQFFWPHLETMTHYAGKRRKKWSSALSV